MGAVELKRRRVGAAPQPVSVTDYLKIRRLKISTLFENFNLAIKISITTFRIPHKEIRHWWVARLTFSISLEIFYPRGRF